MLLISILTDYGSTDNFISEHITKLLGLLVVDVIPFSVGIVDKNQMTSAGTCQLSLTLEGNVFDVTVNLLAVKRSDVLLGVIRFEIWGISSLTLKS